MSNAPPFKWSEMQQYNIEHKFMETDINSPDVSQVSKQVEENPWKQIMLFTTLHFPFGYPRFSNTALFRNKKMTQRHNVHYCHHDNKFNSSSSN